MKKPAKQPVKHQTKSIEQKASTTGSSDGTVVFLFICYLLVEFLPYAKRMEIIKPQFLYLTVLNILVSFFIYFQPGLLSGKIVSAFKRSYAFKAYLIFTVICGISMFAGRNFSLGISSLAEILVVLSMLVNITLLIYEKWHLIYQFIFLVALTAFFQVFVFFIQAQAKPDASLLFLVMSNTLTGNTGNINIFSASLLFKIPFMFLGISYFSDWRRWFLILTLGMTIFIISLISARASLLSLSVISIFYIGFSLTRTSIKKEVWTKLAYGIVPIILAFVLSNLFFLNDKPGSRYSGTVKSIENITSQSSNSNQLRILYWTNALKMIREKPLIGIGLGNWRVESVPYEKPEDGVVSLHAHDDFLELAAETGIVNGLIYLSVFAVLLIVNLKYLVKLKNDEQKSIAALTLMLLTIYGVDALFNFPFYRPTMQLCFCFIMALSLINSLNFFEPAEIKLGLAGRVVLLMLSILPFYYNYKGDQTSQMEYKIRRDHVDTNKKRALTGDEIVNNQPYYPDVLTSSESFMEYAGIYYRYEKNYDKAIQYLDKANEINPYFGRPNFYKQAIAKEKGMVDSAYYYMKSSFYDLPSDKANVQVAISFAAFMKDTTEILKMYQANMAEHKNPRTWILALNGFRVSGYSNTGIENFFKEGFKAFPKDSAVHMSYHKYLMVKYIQAGQKLFAAGKHAEALASYNKVLETDPTNIYALQNIGLYYYNTQNFKEAIPYLLKSLEKPGFKDGISEFFTGISYATLKDHANGCKYLNLAKNKGYVQAQKYLDLYCK